MAQSSIKKKTNFRKISLIIPSYRQAKTIVKNVNKVQSAIEAIGYDYEIIVIVDGLMDKTYRTIKNQESKIKNLRVLGYEKNMGKGYAVKFGVAEATGDVIGFIDAGMDIDPAGITMLLNHMIWYDADIIVGSKMHPVSQVNYPLYRKVLSWGYRTFTRLLFGFKIRDTQVGIKFYKGKVAKNVFPRLLVKNFAFDVEILALAYALGYKRIYEAPIKLKFNGISSITSTNLWKTIILMLWDTMAIFYRVRIIKYYKKSNKNKWLKDR